MPADRRASKRCEIQFEEIQIAIHNNRKLYPVKDISTGGLAIEYSPVTEEPFESEAIDISAADYNRFYLPNIACKTVYDIATLMEGRSFRGADMRIRGLKFIELTKEQEEKLAILLKRFFESTA